MTDNHSHAHDHGTENVSDLALLGAVIVNGGLSVFEFAAGLISGSVALMADALHNLTDAASSVAVLAGGAAITWLNWYWVDPAITLMIAGYILWMSVGMLKTTSRIMQSRQGTFDHCGIRNAAIPKYVAQEVRCAILDEKEACYLPHHCLDLAR